MNHKRLGEIFQGIYDRFDKMRPISLEELENETLNALSLTKLQRLAKGRQRSPRVLE